MFFVLVKLWSHIADLLGLVHASFQKPEKILVSFIVWCIKIFTRCGTSSSSSSMSSGLGALLSNTGPGNCSANFRKLVKLSAPNMTWCFKKLFCEWFGFCMTGNCKGVSRKGSLDLGIIEISNYPIISKHAYLFYTNSITQNHSSVISYSFSKGHPLSWSWTLDAQPDLTHKFNKPSLNHAGWNRKINSTLANSKTGITTDALNAGWKSITTSFVP